MPIPQPPAPSPRRLILASQSPRRRELLADAGYDFTVVLPNEDVECGVCSEFGPAGLVADLAHRKAAAVRRQLQQPIQSPAPNLRPPPIIVAADTVAECDGFILGKPRDEADARAMLTQLSGRDHRVLTGVCLWPLFFAPVEGSSETAPMIRVAVTRLRMNSLTKEQLDDYLSSSAWEGKAGAFGYQDRLAWVHIIEGSESNVVGLPMELLAEMLADLANSSM